ncbi:MAG: fumarate hydratase, partial [Anaerohalosphaera sp.]|nr:fumarate hydratase [Anaerohalosphaera sp.]
MATRTIQYETVVETVERLCIESCYELPDDVLKALKSAADRETDERAKKILGQLIENASLAQQERIPLCQDTGLTVVFVEQGADVTISVPDDDPKLCITDAINEGVAKGYENGLLRKSIVAEPLNERTNTKTNTPAVIHYSIVPGDKL